ncbi:hypothetical protein [Flexivirga meconopsidis]|uniref:hypothetical protein n=1 Tax=Flexivirga meconopsidis TaxID=2977121 RepID=UPI0022406D04|nr:hypothetical protein [Flexivirga meconopsidis]
MTGEPIKESEIASAAELLHRGLIPWRDVRRPDSLLRRIRPGDYVDADRWADLHPIERHRALIFATLQRMREPLPMLSHVSAAAAWGMPIIGAWPQRVEVLMDSAAAGSSALIRRHRVRNVPEPVMFGRIPVTSAARTVIDLARTCDLATAFAAGDWALRSGLCTSDELADEALAIPRRGYGRKAALTVHLLADPRAESPGESLSRARMYEGGFPQPELQVDLIDSAGTFGRGDFGWKGLIGEFDGERKYRATGDAGDVVSETIVIKEKKREDRVRRTGKDVARWCWTDALYRRGLYEVLTAAGLTRSGNREWRPYRQ